MIWGFFEDISNSIFESLFPTRLLADANTTGFKLTQLLSWQTQSIPQAFVVRPSLKSLYPNSEKISEDSEVVLFNTRWVWQTDFHPEKNPGNHVWVNASDQIIALKINGSQLKQLSYPLTLEKLEPFNLKQSSVESELIEFPDDLLSAFEKHFQKYLEFYKTTHQLPMKESVSGINPDDYPLVQFDTRQGPIVIEENVEIEPFCLLKGPLWIGAHSKIKAHTRLEFVSAHHQSRLSGEISYSLFDDYSNKQHEGFIGHSYIGQWVNLGAGTTTSNLKNNYQPIRLNIPSKSYQTKRQFLGSILGDFIKTGIGTRLTCGSFWEFGSSYASHQPAPKHLPALQFISNSLKSKQDQKKFFETLEKVMQRRQVSLSEEVKNILNQHF